MEEVILHVMPVNDLEEHIQSCMCKCMPNIKVIEDSDSLIWVHNSFDGREGVEWANEILGN